MRIYWKLVLIVLVLELFLASVDAYGAIDCHMHGGECWPWFLMFVFNLPASLLIWPYLYVLEAYLGFYPEQIIIYILFVAIGTLWWSFVAHIVIAVLSWLANVVQVMFRQ